MARSKTSTVKTTAPIPHFSNPNGGLGIAALENMWRKPARQIRQWVEDGLLTQRDDHFFDTAEVQRFIQDNPDLLEPTPYESPGERQQ